MKDLERLKVVHLTTSLNPGGIGFFIADLLPQLRSMGIDSEVVVTHQRGDLAVKLEAQGFQVHSCLRHGQVEVAWSYRVGKLLRRLGDLSFWFRLARLLKQLKPDIVHSHMHGELWITQIWATHAAEAAWLMQLHSPSSAYPNSWVGNKIFPCFFKLQDRFVILSRGSTIAYEKMLTKFPDQVAMISNGINDPQDFNHQTNLRNEMGVSTDTLVIGTIGRLISMKRVDLIIKAFARVAQDDVNAQLWIIGEGVEREKLEDQIQTLGLTDKVRLFGFQPNPHPWYDSFDIFVIASMFEGSSIASLEAMSHSLPVIGTNVSGTQDLIDHEKTGLLVPSENTEALAEAMSRLMHSEELRSRLGKIAREKFLEKYEIKKCATSYYMLYDQMLASSSKKAK